MKLRHLAFLLLVLPLQAALGYNYDTLFVRICGDTVKIYNLEWSSACGSRFVISSTVRQDSIFITEMDTSTRILTCSCEDYGMVASLVGLQGGTYRVSVYRGHSHWTDSSGRFVKAISFSLSGSSSLASGASCWGGWCGASRSADLNSVDLADNRAPERYYLVPNYPNPFNPTTTITFELRSTSHIRLSVLDLLGHEVTLLEDAVRTAGRHQVVFDGKGQASGIYFARLQSDSHIETQRMVLAR